MAKILGVGIATLDIVNEVSRYPAEDAEVRAVDHSVRRGGNATNTLVVLTQLGHACDWAGVLVDQPGAAPVQDELARYRINTRYCRRLTSGAMPTSYITLSRDTGTRTIVHYRDLPEYDRAAFAAIPLQDFAWVHFEGRNVEESLHMMSRIRAESAHIPVSLEVEKPRAGIERLFPLADLILFSRTYAENQGLPSALLLRQVQQQAPQADLVCTLGDQGATGLSRDGEQIAVDASEPGAIVDTLGAGDTFNAGMIDALVRGAALADAMRFATKLAGNKCAQAGLHNLDLPARVGMTDGL